MLTVKKENVVYRIDDSEKQKYLKNGFNVIDKKGKIIEGTNKIDRDKLVEEINKLNNEISKLVEEKKELEAKVQEITETNATLAKEKKELEKQVKTLSKEKE